MRTVFVFVGAFAHSLVAGNVTRLGPGGRRRHHVLGSWCRPHCARSRFYYSCASRQFPLLPRHIFVTTSGRSKDALPDWCTQREETAVRSLHMMPFLIPDAACCYISFMRNSTFLKTLVSWLTFFPGGRGAILFYMIFNHTIQLNLIKN